jgi:tetratricopeptide (TPR) repeat protein
MTQRRLRPSGEPDFRVMKRLRKATVRAILVACFVSLAVCGSAPYFFHRWSQGATAEPFFAGLGPYSRKVTTHSEAAQKYFDQGLAFLYGFNYDAAGASFQAAAASDPNCAMAYWGIAMANGGGVDDSEAIIRRAVESWKASRNALEHAQNASPVEQALIKAVSKRFDMPPPLDRKPLDESYASYMRRAWQAFPDDPDIGALTAKAISRARTLDVCVAPGQPLPPSEEVVHALEKVLAQHPNHPYALHLFVHALEGSDQFERAKGAADRLRDMAPGLSHITHMPTHIDIRRGDWHAALVASEKAVAADKAYQKIVADPGFYRGLILHNNHMLAYVAAMQGQSRKATQTVQELLTNIPHDYLERDVERVDFYYALPYQLHIRFGRWKAMLAEPAPQPDLPIATAMWHLARSTAYAANHELGEAKFEQTAFISIVQSFLPDARFRKNNGQFMFRIAAAALAGEILYREGKVDEALGQLREAVRGEDSLLYMEPPDWVQPMRHILGATLMDAGRYAEAEAVYREDLVRHPENGWSLFGLSQSLRKQKKSAEADDVAARFQHVWQHADIKLTASCLCLPAKE